MKVTIELPDEVAARLEAKANRVGLHLEDLLVRDAMARDTPSEAERLERLRRIREEIDQIRERNVLVDDLDIRSMIEEGRRF